MSFDRERAIRASTPIELLVIIAILAVIAAPIIRVVFADEFRAFDEALFRRLGIEPGLGRLITAALVLVALASWACYQVRVRRRAGSHREAAVSQITFSRQTHAKV